MAERLGEMRREIVSKMESLRLDSSASASDDIKDIADEASRNYQRDLLGGMNEVGRETLRQIDEALKKIAGGFYGVCEDCEEPIGDGRLEARPFSRLCVGCKSDLEKARGA